MVVMDQGVVNSMKARKGSDTAGLTPHQQQVLSMMAKDYNNSAIADNLVLGTKSVENYINAIYQELHLGHNGDLHPRVQVRSSLTSATPPSGIPGALSRRGGAVDIPLPPLRKGAVLHSVYYLCAHFI